MTKLKIASVLAGAAMLLSAGTAFAATPNNVLFDNGVGNVPATPGSTVNMNLYVTTSNSEAVESVFVTFPGAGGLAEQGACYTVSPSYDSAQSPAGGWLVSAEVTVPDHVGTWPVRVRTYGVAGDGANLNCVGSSNGTGLFNNRITVSDDNTPTGSLTPNSGGSTTTTGSTADLMAQIAALTAQINAILHPATPAPAPASTLCSQLTNAMVGAQMNVYNSGNISLQGFLLYQHQSIPALAAGASFGFWGPQTNAALASFKAQNSCQ